MTEETVLITARLYNQFKLQGVLHDDMILNMPVKLVSQKNMPEGVTMMVVPASLAADFTTSMRENIKRAADDWRASHGIGVKNG